MKINQAQSNIIHLSFFSVLNETHSYQNWTVGGACPLAKSYWLIGATARKREGVNLRRSVPKCIFGVSTELEYP